MKQRHEDLLHGRKLSSALVIDNHHDLTKTIDSLHHTNHNHMIFVGPIDFVDPKVSKPQNKMNKIHRKKKKRTNVQNQPIRIEHKIFKEIFLRC